MIYTESFKAKMVQRLTEPDAISANRLAQEVGVAQSVLSRWVRKAHTLGPMSKVPPSESNVLKSTAHARSASEKVRLVMAAAALRPEELGAFLRREGVHEAELEQWRAAVLEGGQAALAGASAPRSGARAGEARRIKELEKELRRKDKALAETAALLVLQKKVREIWGDADDDTDEPSGK